MKEEVKKLIEKASKDTELKNKFKNAKNVNDVLSIAKEAGFSVTEDDIKLAQKKDGGVSEISDEELAKVFGGGGCGCWFGGFGSGSNKNGDFFCQCAGAGFGAYTDFKHMDEGCCTCVVHGGGATNSGGC